MPGDLASRDLFHGPGGAELGPQAGAAFTWVATDTTGYSPGFDLRSADGREWSAKLGPEAQTEVASSRILWALGYHQPPTYYVKSWQLSGGPGGQQPAARLRADFEGSKVIGDWSWSKNDFVGTQPFRGLIVANILLNSWDWKTSNNKIYQHVGWLAAIRRARSRRIARQDVELEAPLDDSHARPRSGFAQRHRGLRIAGVHQARRRERSGFRFRYHLRVRRRPRASRGRAMDGRPDEQASAMPSWDDAFRAADYSPEVRARYIKKIKAKIAEGLAVS